ncbi:hypothetical protein JOC86_000492 [Bacillus pakistanensis]|uniref:ATP synthase F0 subunit 8 n=1 Tax=Rossellomorea pakistanensis TaxID=992288 RepID=A0ABS2N7X0_9BACI|nr:hypothetical protein [Bacillus pakistanensis]MBM7583955.1 hypothetical protein [Bacillus pakistanensis]
MTLLGWIFWGSILIVIVLAVVLQKRGMKPPSEKTYNQLKGEKQSIDSSKINYPGDNGGA